MADGNRFGVPVSHAQRNRHAHKRTTVRLFLECAKGVSCRTGGRYLGRARLEGRHLAAH